MATILAKHGFGSADPLPNAQRDRALRIAQAHGFPPSVVDEAMQDADNWHNAGDALLSVFLRAIHTRLQCEAGVVPEGWTERVRCQGCGEVWLPPDTPQGLLCCSWCRNRCTGRPIPRPDPEAEGASQ